MIDYNVPEKVQPDKKMKEFSKRIISLLCWVYIVLGIIQCMAYTIQQTITQGDWNELEYVLAYFKDPIAGIVIVYLAKSAFENYNKYKRK